MPTHTHNSRFPFPPKFPASAVIMISIERHCLAFFYFLNKQMSKLLHHSVPETVAVAYNLSWTKWYICLWIYLLFFLIKYRITSGILCINSQYEFLSLDFILYLYNPILKASRRSFSNTNPSQNTPEHLHKHNSYNHFSIHHLFTFYYHKWKNTANMHAVIYLPEYLQSPFRKALWAWKTFYPRAGTLCTNSD